MYIAFSLQLHISCTLKVSKTNARCSYFRRRGKCSFSLKLSTACCHLLWDKRHTDSHAECELSFQCHSLFGLTHLTSRVVFTQGDECDWLMGRWSPCPPPPWLAFSFWQNTVIMGFSDQQGKIPTLLRLESQGETTHCRTVWHQWNGLHLSSELTQAEKYSPPDLSYSLLFVFSVGEKSSSYSTSSKV